MAVVEKPATLTTVEAEVAAKWQGDAFWDHLVAMLLYDEATGTPQMWRRGAAKINVTEGGTPTWEDDVDLGWVIDFDATPDWHQVNNADLPANFPGKANTPYTILAYMRADAIGATKNVIVLHTPDGDTSGPYFLYLNSNNTIGSNPGGSSVNSTSTVSAGTPYLLGSRYDGTNARMVFDGTLQGSVAMAALPTSTTRPLLIARRGDTSSPFAGDIGIIYVLDAAIAEALLQDLAADPYGPVTAASGTTEVGRDAAAEWAARQLAARDGLAAWHMAGFVGRDASAAWNTGTFAVQGTVTLGGSPVEGATVRLINMTTDALVGEMLTEADGTYSFTGLDPEAEYHAAVEHQVGATKYHALSQPFLVPS